jgi:hypothetical protein
MNMIKIRTLWLATSVPFALISIGWCYLYSSDLGLSLLTGIASALIFGLMMSLAAFGITRFLNLSALKWEVLLICMGSLGLVVSAVFFLLSLNLPTGRWMPLSQPKVKAEEIIGILPEPPNTTLSMHPFNIYYRAADNEIFTCSEDPSLGCTPSALSVEDIANYQVKHAFQPQTNIQYKTPKAPGQIVDQYNSEYPEGDGFTHMSAILVDDGTLWIWYQWPTWEILYVLPFSFAGMLIGLASGLFIFFRWDG